MSEDHKANGAAFDDIAGVIGGVAGVVSEMRTQIKQDIQSRVQSAADQANLASMEDVERLEAMLKALDARVSALEKKTK